jgi:hypothetical protein
MKTYLNLSKLHSVTLALAFVSLLTVVTTHGQTNQPSASVHVVYRNILPGAGTSERKYYYDIDYPGGNIGEFFRFWRKNGFTNDSVILVGDLNRVYINAFKIKDAHLNEIAKSIESISEGQLSVEVVDKTASDRGNIWTVKNAGGLGRIKTRSCALPAIFSGPNPTERIANMSDQVQMLLDSSGVSGRGRVQILASEKIVVVVGTEAYVEAMTGVLEAAEKVAETEKVGKSKPQ